MRSADRLIRWAATLAVAGLAMIAGALSYSHMRVLAERHGQPGWAAHAFPLSVDGLEVVATLAVVACHRAGTRPGWLPWAMLAGGGAASLFANAAVALPDPLSRGISAWPVLALLASVKLLAGLLEPAAIGQHTAVAASPEAAADVPEVVPVEPAAFVTEFRERQGRRPTGAEVGKAFGRSDRWGRARLAEATP